MRPRVESPAHLRVGSIAELPDQQRRVAVMLASGLTCREAGIFLGVSVKTCDTHRIQALRRLGLRNVADLTRAAIREGLVSMHDGGAE